MCHGASIHTVVTNDPVMSAFEKWMGDFGLVYKSDAEKQLCFDVFKANFEFIESMKNQPGLTYGVGLNQFADLTNAEFLAKYATLTLSKRRKTSTSHEYANLTSVPTSIDWRLLGAVTPIKNQGQCGYQDVTAYSETALENAAANQPVSVAIAASGLAFQLYSGGIFTGPCSTKLDHGVTVVGYDNTGRTRYWMVKNLRGASWGSLVT